jgi:hypothetical protein
LEIRTYVNALFEDISQRTFIDEKLATLLLLGLGVVPT